MQVFLETTARAVLDSCSVAPGAACGSGTNTLGFRAITPGGYPAVWIQDFTMNFSSGLLDREVGLNHLRLILEKQNGDKPKDLGCEVIVPPYAIADHINLDGEPVFFPGTYDPAAHQDGAWGFRPPTNNNYDVIWLAHVLATSGDSPALLKEPVKGKTVCERLQLAFGVPEIDPATQLVHTTAERRLVKGVHRSIRSARCVGFDLRDLSRRYQRGGQGAAPANDCPCTGEGGRDRVPGSVAARAGLL